MATPDNIVRLDVGGTKFHTMRSTLTTRDPSSVLADMVSKHPVSDTKLVIDRDGTHFRHVLNWLRDGVVSPDLELSAYRELLCEAQHYRLLGLVNSIKPLLCGKHPDDVHSVKLPSIVNVEEGLTTLTCRNNFGNGEIMPKPDMSHLDVPKLLHSLQLLDPARRQRFPLQLRGINLSEPILSNITLTRVDFRNARLTRTNFGYADLSGADFTDCVADGAIFKHAQLSGCKFTGAKMTGAVLDGSNLYGANLSTACLSKASFCKATLSSANMQYADLSEADLSGADISNTDLSNAKLTGAVLTESIRNSTTRF